MSLGPMLAVLAANAAMPAIFVELPSQVIASSDVAVMHRGQPLRAETSGPKPANRVTALGADQPATVDLAFYVGSRHSGAQLELGALGGGRADAPALVHVGVGFDF